MFTEVLNLHFIYLIIIGFFGIAKFVNLQKCQPICLVTLILLILLIFCNILSTYLPKIDNQVCVGAKTLIS